MLENRKKHYAGHCATSLGSFVSHERVTMSPLGRERPDREQQGHAVTLKPASAQNSLHVGASDGAVVVWLPSPYFFVIISIRETL